MITHISILVKRRIVFFSLPIKHINKLRCDYKNCVYTSRNAYTNTSIITNNTFVAGISFLHVWECVSNTYLIELSHKTQLFHMDREHMCEAVVYISVYVYYIPDLVYISTVTALCGCLIVYIPHSRSAGRYTETRNHRIEAGATSPIDGEIFKHAVCHPTITTL